MATIIFTWRKFTPGRNTDVPGVTADIKLEEEVLFDLLTSEFIYIYLNDVVTISSKAYNFLVLKLTTFTNY